jgi:hypothetical protein
LHLVRDGRLAGAVEVGSAGVSGVSGICMLRS